MWADNPVQRWFLNRRTHAITRIFRRTVQMDWCPSLDQAWSMNRRLRSGYAHLQKCVDGVGGVSGGSWGRGPGSGGEYWGAAAGKMYNTIYEIYTVGFCSGRQSGRCRSSTSELGDGFVSCHLWAFLSFATICSAETRLR